MENSGWGEPEAGLPDRSHPRPATSKPVRISLRLMLIAFGVLAVAAIAATSLFVLRRAGTTSVARSDVAAGTTAPLEISGGDEDPGPTVDPGFAALCDELGGEPASDDDTTYCLGPETIDLSVALESAQVATPPSQSLIELSFKPGPAGIEHFNQLAALCFEQTEACPTGRLAIVFEGRVLSAPAIQAPVFERDQIVVSGKDTTAEAAGTTSLLPRSSIKPVLYVLDQDGELVVTSLPDQPARPDSDFDFDFDDKAPTTSIEAQAPPPLEPGESLSGQTPCPSKDGSAARTTSFSEPPQMCIDPERTYRAVVETNQGRFVIELSPSEAPVAVNNFVVLARYHYYDGSVFHRVINEFVVQGGDPFGDPTGTGGPGYALDEEPPTEGRYQVGSVAMAKTSAPGTTGSQFFVITGVDGERLPPDYSLLGTVVEGLDVVVAISELPTNTFDYPLQPVVVERITIEEG